MLAQLPLCAAAWSRNGVCLGHILPYLHGVTDRFLVRLVRGGSGLLSRVSRFSASPLLSVRCVAARLVSAERKCWSVCGQRLWTAPVDGSARSRPLCSSGCAASTASWLLHLPLDVKSPNASLVGASNALRFWQSRRAAPRALCRPRRLASLCGPLVRAPLDPVDACAEKILTCQACTGIPRAGPRARPSCR